MARQMDGPVYKRVDALCRYNDQLEKDILSAQEKIKALLEEKKERLERKVEKQTDEPDIKNRIDQL